MRMSDLIEAFIKDQLSLVDENEVELKRNEVAERFKCAPSQINYVLSTRFTRDNGYIIESRRGGGGYIRIVRVVYPRGQKMLDLVQQRIGEAIDELRAGRIIDGLTEGGYITQEEAAMMRGAISAIPKGQYEAGYSVGMNYFQIMFRIVLPQAFRVAFPPLFNELIALVKNTSLAASITVSEMFREAQKIAARTFEPFALYCEVALIYLIICTVLTRLQVYGEKRLSTFTGKRKI